MPPPPTNRILKRSVRPSVRRAVSEFPGMDRRVTTVCAALGRSARSRHASGSDSYLADASWKARTVHPRSRPRIRLAARPPGPHPSRGPDRGGPQAGQRPAPGLRERRGPVLRPGGVSVESTPRPRGCSSRFDSRLARCPVDPAPEGSSDRLACGPPTPEVADRRNRSAASARQWRVPLGRERAAARGGDRAHRRS